MTLIVFAFCILLVLMIGYGFAVFREADAEPFTEEELAKADIPVKEADIPYV